MKNGNQDRWENFQSQLISLDTKYLEAKEWEEKRSLWLLREKVETSREEEFPGSSEAEWKLRLSKSSSPGGMPLFASEKETNQKEWYEIPRTLDVFPPKGDQHEN